MGNVKQTVFDKKQYLADGTCIKTYILCNIIDLCNQSCKYCYNKTPRTGVKLDLTKLRDFVIYLIQHKRKRKIEVILLGGEPTLHKDLEEFCAIMDRLEVRCTVMSNFSSSINLYLQLLELHNVQFDFSWHSTYSCQTSFIDKIEQIPYKYFEDERIDITVMYEQDAHEESLHIFNQLREKYRKYLDLAFISPIANKYTYNYTKDQLFQHKLAVENNKSTRQEYDNISFCTDNGVDDIATNDVMNPMNDLNNFNRWLCNAGQDQLYVHYNGDIAACPDMYFQRKTVFGNIYALANIKNMHCTLCQAAVCTCPFYAKKTKIF